MTTKYTVILESETPPKLMLGERVGGALVISLTTNERKLATASELAEKFNISAKTVREKLTSINEGTAGKFLYNPAKAAELLKIQVKKGRKRIN